MLRNLDRKRRKDGGKDGEVIATPGEILAEDEGALSSVIRRPTTRACVPPYRGSRRPRCSAPREENQVHLSVVAAHVAGAIDEARAKLARADMLPAYRASLLAIIAALIGAAIRSTKVCPTDELMVVSGLSSEQVRKAFYDLEALGLASNDMPNEVMKAPPPRPGR